MTYQNDLGQLIGFPVPEWTLRPHPSREPVSGRFCRIEPISIERHAGDLHTAYLEDTENRIWTYLPYGPFQTLADYTAWMQRTCLGDDPLFHAIIDLSSGKAVGVASYLRIDPLNGVIEVGHINYAPRLQRTPIATEAMYLLMKRVFEAGYRRYEWKCDALNARSRAAAQRLGFSYEGIFRQAAVYKGRNRDTAWYAIIDAEWPQLQAAYQVWLAPENFSASGQQLSRLSTLTGPTLK